MMKRTGSLIFYLNFALLMLGLGCSDAVRGVFAPVFQSHFALNASQISLMMTVSYTGNLVFMLFGSRLADCLGVKRIFLSAIAVWVAALALYLATDSYRMVLIGVFFAMGTSTLMNMLMNLMSPSLFASPGMVINTLFFVQGIGTTVTQSVIGASVSQFSHWKLVNFTLAVIGILSFILFFTASLRDGRIAGQPAPKKEEDNGGQGLAQIFKRPAFWFFFLIFGFYFVGEHGIMNWMNIYCLQALHMPAGQAAVFPALFFGGITAGRLLLAPAVGRLGVKRSLVVFLGIGCVLYGAALLAGGAAFYGLAAAGFCISIVYPTMTMCIQLFFPKEITATATGVIMSCGTLFDIAFNAGFGSLIDRIGYQAGMSLLPVSMAACFVIYLLFIRTVKQVRTL